MTLSSTSSLSRPGSSFSSEFGRSGLIETRNARVQAEHHLQLLKARVAKLAFEEERALKTAHISKLRAEEVKRLREEAVAPLRYGVRARRAPPAVSDWPSHSWAAARWELARASVPADAACHVTDAPPSDIAHSRVPSSHLALRDTRHDRQSVFTPSVFTPSTRSRA